MQHAKIFSIWVKQSQKCPAKRTKPDCGHAVTVPVFTVSRNAMETATVRMAMTRVIQAVREVKLILMKMDQGKKIENEVRCDPDRSDLFGIKAHASQ